MDDSIEQLLLTHPPEIQVLARELRNIIKTVMPEARESVYHGALSYSLSKSVFDRLVYLDLDKNYIRLGFTFGRYLPDPGHHLVGEGKRMRHVKIFTNQDVDQTSLELLLKAAWENGTAHVAELKKQRAEARKVGK